MMRKSLITVLCVAMIVAGCASQSSAISAKSISPVTYAGWECSQISAELIRINQQIATLEGRQDQIYKRDQIMGWIGALLLWPALFFIKGDGEVASELASAKGTANALEQMQIQKNCGAN